MLIMITSVIYAKLKLFDKIAAALSVISASHELNEQLVILFLAHGKLFSSYMGTRTYLAFTTNYCYKYFKNCNKHFKTTKNK